MAVEDNSFVSKIITGDESWCFQYESTKKRQSAEWVGQGSPRAKKVRMTKSKTKVLLIAFFDADGMVHSEFVPPSTTINAQYYLGVMQRLCNRIRRVQPQRWAQRDFFLLYDNTPAHMVALVVQFLVKKQIPVIAHPPYSPDLAPADFFLFLRLKLRMKRERYEDVIDIQSNMTRELKAISKEAFQKSFQWLRERAQRCIDVQGDYVEHCNQ